MHLIYFDESGNTGNNLDDTQQPVFVLAGLVVPEEVWQDAERDLQTLIDTYFPDPRPDNFEIHGTDLRSGRGSFKDMSVGDRIVFRDACFDIAHRHDLKLIYRAIVKKRYQRWQQNTFGLGVQINPHIVAFPLVAHVANEYLHTLPGTQRGVIISDENKEIGHDIEKSIKILRGIEGKLRLDRIVEKGFFIESTKSLMLQLCDMCALSARKKEEGKAGLPVKSFDESGIIAIDRLIYRSGEDLQDVLGWIAEQQKK
ncbi:MAG: hypothetical protein ACI8V2_000131 [Candidatus Latescibacterota bacterium]